MREIRFRGLRTDGKGWVYGSYDWNWKHINKYYIYELKGRKIIGHEVIPETVCQFTGLKDKNGTEIYEGDLFAPDTDNDEVKAVVRWSEESAMFVVDSYGYNFHIGEGSQEVYDNELSICDTCNLGDMILEYCEVIGSIHTTHDKGKEESC